jgi:glycerate 2-kinase
MANSMPVLVAPDALEAGLRAPVVAAAIGRGLERAGLGMPDLCPVAGGGRGTLEVLLPALGGETASARVLDPLGHEIVAGFGLVDGGGTAIVEAAQIGGAPHDEAGAPAASFGTGQLDEAGALAASSFGTGQLVAAAIDAGAAVVVLACGGSPGCDGGAGAVEAIEHGGGLRGAVLVALCDERTPWEGAAAHCAPAAGAAGARRLRERAQRLTRDPRGVPMTGAGGGLAGGLWAQLGARLVPGAGFVLEQLGFDARMRAARAVVVGEARLDAGTLGGRVTGEIAIRARQSGVPCHAVVAADEIERFDARILDLQAILEAGTVTELEAAGERLARFL